MILRRQLLHGVNESGDMIRINTRGDAMTQVKDMPATVPVTR